MKWLILLQKRWGVNSLKQVIVILIVFACTGTTVMVIKPPIMSFLFQGQPAPTWATVLYYVLMPIFYNIILLGYGYIFGQFTFFWEFEKRFMGRVFTLFRKKK